MKIKYSTIAMSRNKYSSFRTAERVWKTLFKANVTVLLLVLIKNVNISRLNRIGRQLQPVELAAGELAVNWQTTSAYGWGRISRYCQTSSTWNICWRNGRGGDWFIPSSKWPSIQSSCFSSWLLFFYRVQELSLDHNLLLSLSNIRSHFLSQ